jgi:hypothetical protein
MTRITVDIPNDVSTIFRKRLEYVLDFIQNHPCAPMDVFWSINSQYGAINISYHPNCNGLTMPNADFCFENVVDTKLPAHISFQYQGLTLYGFKGKNDENSHFDVDVFQTIFFHISRLEEWQYSPNDQDFHGMLQSKNHFLVKHGIHELPIVDHLVFYLYQKIGLTPIKLETKYNISHDVDAIQKFPSFYKFIRAIANVTFYQNNKVSNLGNLFSIWYQFYKGKIKDPYDTFDWLLSTNHPKIINKYLYVLSGGKTKYENFFDIRNPKIKDLINFAQRNGYVIGIHPSYMAGENSQMTESELKVLEEISGLKIKDSRQHFLRYHIPKTGEILEQLNLKTDSSFGYRNLIGFRCGTGFPYRMYNFNKEVPFNFIEIPLVVMDMALIHCHGRDTKLICDHLNSFLQKNEFYTRITFNFHNSTFDPTLMNTDGLIALYLSLFKG